MPSRRDRLHYAFDNFMARGTIALIAGLFAVSAIGILVISLVIAIMGLSGEGMSLPDLLWRSLMRTLDPGTMGGDTGSAGFLFGMLAVTFGGIFVISALIGVINTGLEGKLGELRKGRSRVVETNHTVVLGWSQQVFTVLAELMAANANLAHRSAVVVLADRDKVEMEDEIRARFPDTGKTTIVCRSGKPMDIDDLEIARLETSRAILVLSPEVDDPDAEVVKTLLAITNHPRRRPERYHIVAELHNPANLDIARLVGRDEVQLLLGGDIISRIVAQTCRQSGLSIVYTELLDFDGDEIYFSSLPALAGRTFGDALFAFEDSTLIGLQPAGGVPRLNPPMDTLIGPGDEVIVISADDDTVRLHPEAAAVDGSAIRTPSPKSAVPERTLVLGWNWRAPTIIRELDAYVPPESLAEVVADLPGPRAALDELRPLLANQSVTFRHADTTSRAVLDALDVPSFDNIIVLCYSDDLEPQRADSKTLFTLLHLRDMQERTGQDFSIVSEMLDLRTRALAEVTHADDFIVSSRLVSLLMAQVAENPRLNAVFSDLFDPDGSEIYLRPAPDYVEAGTEVTFATIVEA
ncbi:MAG: potassium transporter TrkA, partial [Chloroflexota bacterium]|nr:potassium transporter TrkA [Chloroflexota bacterium]